MIQTLLNLLKVEHDAKRIEVLYFAGYEFMQSLIPSLFQFIFNTIAYLFKYLSTDVASDAAVTFELSSRSLSQPTLINLSKFYFNSGSSSLY